MKVTIIKPDGFVSKDGVGFSGLSLSSIASDVWAVHWDSSTSKGELEKTDLLIFTKVDLQATDSQIRRSRAHIVLINMQSELFL